MLLNNWYVAADVEALKDGEPLGVRMLGADFVLFRDAGGRIVCLSDVCCHRGAALSAGKVKGSCIACPYHGWEFEPSGRCVSIPALGPEVTPPKRARVDSYPVREMFGWIWVFLGDAPEEERPPFLDESWLPEYSDTDNWKPLRFQFDAAANWMRAEENSIDGAHPSFVHSAFGSRRDPKVQIVQIERDAWGASTTRERTPPDRSQKSGRMRELTSDVRGKTRATTKFTITGITHRIVIDRADGLWQRTLSHRTPIDRYNTRTFMIQVRNFDLSDEADAERREGVLKAVEEDKSVVALVRPILPPKGAGSELLTEADQLEGAFRQLVRRLSDRGWEIDSDYVEAESRRQVFVIPSPERRLDPKNWVHRPVPTVPGRDAATLAAE